MVNEEYKEVFEEKRYRRIWRNPSAESINIYEGLVVQDNRKGGSITIRRTRLPLWTLIRTAICENWTDVEDSWNVADYNYTSEELADFLYNLLEMRGEFARLILELANANKENAFWSINEEISEKVKNQLQICLDCLNKEEVNE